MYIFMIKKLPLYNGGKHHRDTNVCVINKQTTIAIEMSINHTRTLNIRHSHHRTYIKTYHCDKSHLIIIIDVTLYLCLINVVIYFH